MAALAAGTTAIAARLDTFAARPALVQVRPPLGAGLSFTPAWEHHSVPPLGRAAFAVRSPRLDRLAIRWYVNGRLQRNSTPQLIHSGSPGQADTVRVEVRAGREKVVRQWVLRPNAPPVLEPMADTLLVVGQEHQCRLRAMDPDGDALFFALEEAPAGLAIDPRSGQLSWTPKDTGRVAVRLRLLDGYHQEKGAFALRVLSPSAKSAGNADLALSGVWPNPFNSGTMIHFALPQTQEVELAIFNLAGQKVATLVEGVRQRGAHSVPWDGRDDQGQRLASGVYLYRLQAGPQVERHKLVLLR
jgi:hypothetical protein